MNNKMIVLGLFQSIRVLPKRLQHHYVEKLTSENRFSFQNESSIRTIGLPIYKAPSEKSYFENADICRRVFQERYTPLYEFVIEELAATLQARIRLTEHLALPGFHIVTGNPRYPFWGGGWHIDRFPKWDNVTDPAYTMTVVLGEFNRRFHTDFCESEVERDVTSIYHVPGRLTVFPSDICHRIGSFDASDREVIRITLQAHLAKREKDFEIFW